MHGWMLEDGSETDTPTQVDDSRTAQPSNPNNESDTSDQADAGEEISVYLSATDDCPERGYFLALEASKGLDRATMRHVSRCPVMMRTLWSLRMDCRTIVLFRRRRMRLQPEFQLGCSKASRVCDGHVNDSFTGTVAFCERGTYLWPQRGPVSGSLGGPVYNDLLDECLGHTGGQGDYHYHAMFVRCLSAIGLEGVEDRSVPSPILGYALDGFPIYGPLGCVDDACTSVVEFKSGWVQTGDPTTYAWDNHAYQPSDAGDILDECNGRIGPDGTYRYHATATFPYVLGCYAGVVTDTGKQRRWWRGRWCRRGRNGSHLM